MNDERCWWNMLVHHHRFTRCTDNTDTFTVSSERYRTSRRCVDAKQDYCSGCGWVDGALAQASEQTVGIVITVCQYRLEAGSVGGSALAQRARVGATVRRKGTDLSDLRTLRIGNGKNIVREQLKDDRTGAGNSVAFKKRISSPQARLAYVRPRGACSGIHPGAVRGGKSRQKRW